MTSGTAQMVGPKCKFYRITNNPTVIENKAIYNNIELIANVKYVLYYTEFMNIILLDYIKNSKCVNVLFKGDI